MATILNPHYRTKWIQSVLKLESKSAKLAETLAPVKQLWYDWLNQHKQQEEQQASYDVRKEKQRRQTAQLIRRSQTRTIEDLSERILGDWKTKATVVDEFEDYIKESSVPERVNSLEWWNNPVRKRDWPRLSEFAILVLSCPAMSDEAERIFSGARRTISWERAKLKPDIIEALECYHHFLKSQISRTKESSCN
jgi:hAT family C-terminal dimerisation region